MNLLLALFLLAPPMVPAAPAPALQETPPDSRPEIAAKIEELAAHVKERGKEDDLAVAAVEALSGEFAKSGPKDRAAIVKALDACFKANRSKELEPGVPDDRLYFAAATALGGMGPESVKLLTDLLGHKSLRSNLRLQARIAKSLGATKDPKGLDPLLALLEHKDKEMQVAGAEALASFGESDLDIRKQVFEQALNVLMDQKSKKDADLNDFEAHERWNAISGPIVTLLQRLARQNETDPDAWLRWWNNNKKEDWDAAKG
jgi:hypothetical protein